MTLKGLQIHPGVIDQDCTGELKILAQAPQTFIALAPTDKIAQSVIFPNVKVGKVFTTTPRGEKGFGHSDQTYWVQRSLLTDLRWFYFLNGRRFMGLLDIGADVSVVAERHWPSSWLCVQATVDLKGVGSASSFTECLRHLLA
jgi:hypothetical protein